MILESHNVFQPQNGHSNEGPAISKFMKFLNHMHLHEKLGEISDTREQKKCTYSSQSLLLWALSVFFFAKKQNIP